MLLDVTYWPDFCRMAERVADWDIDLRDLESAPPPGLIALYLLARHRSRYELTTNIITPTDPGMLRHLSRMKFFARIDPYVKFDVDVGYLLGSRFTPADRFTPILALTDEDGGLRETCDRIWYLLRDHVGRAAARVYSPFEELVSNLADHASPAADAPVAHAFQLQVFWDSIELAFGDLGAGFRASLSGHPRLPAPQGDTDALEVAIQRRRSRFGPEQRHRGGGLRRAVDVVHALGGHLCILSGDGTAVQNPYDPSPVYRSVMYRFPGTLVWMRMPFQAG